MKVDFENSKLESFLVIAVFSLAVSISLNLYFVFNRNDYANFLENARKSHPYLDPVAGFYANDDLLVNMRPLREKLQTMFAGKNAAVYFEYLNTGANISINGDMPFYPGSLMKIPVAMAVMKKIDSGEWNLGNELILTNADKNPNYGALYKLPAGTRFTVEDLLKKLLVDSDDTARSIFIRNVGEGDIGDVLSYLGLDDVIGPNMKVNAKRYSNFWRALYSASYLSSDSSEKLLQIMDLPHDDKLLKHGIPGELAYSHKIGEYGDVYSDSGIIYALSRPYIITMMFQGDKKSAENLMGNVSKVVYEYVTQN